MVEPFFCWYSQKNQGFLGGATWISRMSFHRNDRDQWSPPKAGVFPGGTTWMSRMSQSAEMPSVSCGGAALLRPSCLRYALLAGGPKADVEVASGDMGTLQIQGSTQKDPKRGEVSQRNILQQFWRFGDSSAVLFAACILRGTDLEGREPERFHPR